MFDICLTIHETQDTLYFKLNETWRYQFYKVFQFEHNEGTEAYEKLFFPHLIKPINEHVQSDRCILTENDEWELPENVYTTDEDNESIRGLSEFNLCLKGMEAELLNGKQGSKLLSSKSAMYLPNNLFKI